MTNSKKYVGDETALPRLWERVKALVANKANVITSGKMLSYSTEEQVVGRWIDGKPLYQVTIETTTGSKINTFKEIDLPTDDIERISSINGIMTDRYGVYIPVSGAFVTNDTSTCVKIAYDASKKVLTIWCSQTDWLNAKICITVTYTKTTDTAESEVFDPVAFINKPNLWEPGKEYDFGDGVYGQRFTGSVTHTAAHTPQDIVLTSTIPDSLISSGGNWKRGSSKWTLPIGQISAVAVSDRIYIDLSSTIVIDSKRGLLVIFYNNGAQTSTYDIWVKYTK